MAVPLFASVVWEPAYRLGSTNRNLQNPMVVGDGPGAWLFWQEGRGEGQAPRRLLRFTRLEGPPENLANSLTVLEVPTDRSLMASAIPVGKAEVALACVDGEGQVLVLRGSPAQNQWEAPRRVTRSAGSCFQPSLLYQPGTGALHIFFVEESGGAWRLMLVSFVDQSGVVGGPFVLSESTLTGELPFAPRAVEAGPQVWVFYQARPRWQKDRAPRESIRRLVLEGPSLAPVEDTRISAPDERGFEPTPVHWRDQIALFWRRQEGAHWSLSTQSWKLQKETEKTRHGQKRAAWISRGQAENLPSVLMDPFLSGIDLWGSRLYLGASGTVEGHPGFSLRSLDLSTGRWSSEQLIERDGVVLGSRVVEGPEGRLLIQELDRSTRGLECLVEDTRVAPPRFTQVPDPETWYDDRSLPIAWRAPVDPSGVAGYGFVVSPRPDTKAPLATLGEFQTRLDLGPWLAEGTNYFHLAAWDRAGNVSAVVSTRILVDRLPPTLVSLWSLSHAEAHWSSNARVILRVHAESQRGGALQYGWAVFPSLPTAEEALEQIGKRPPLPSSLFTAQCRFVGTNVIAVSARDDRGRWSQPGFHEVWVEGAASLAEAP
ncbi:MAG: hypothetical protein J0L75_10620 [Spirochaetes bacterium]|nr:hypothetical protein [Spirochaetota bacterium]